MIIEVAEMAGHLLVAVFAFVGFMIAGYIRGTKKNSTVLVCPLEGSCETVVHSDYSRFFGIPVELIGMLYYGLVAVTYLIFAFVSWSVPNIISYSILGLSVLAFCFSMYLTAIQAFVLKHWCTWCLFSAGICTVIFILALLIMDTRILELLT